MRRTEEGLTLIEILLSILVLVLGIVGILALFPTALQTNRETMEERQAAMIAESVKNAITNALRLRNPTTGMYQFVHDPVMYPFSLPTLGVTARRHPGEAGAGIVVDPDTEAGKPEAGPAFVLAGDAWIRLTVEHVQGKGAANASRASADPSENLRQFAYSFDVTKVDTLKWNTELDAATKEQQIRLYEFRINVFRIEDPPAAGTNTITGGAIKHLILTMVDRVTAK